MILFPVQNNTIAIGLKAVRYIMCWTLCATDARDVSADLTHCSHWLRSLTAGVTVCWDVFRPVHVASYTVYSSCLRPSGIFTSLLARRTKPVQGEPFLYKVHVIGMQGRNVNHVYFIIGAERIRYKFIGLICQWTLIPRPNIAASGNTPLHPVLYYLPPLSNYAWLIFICTLSFYSCAKDKSHSNRCHMYV